MAIRTRGRGVEELRAQLARVNARIAALEAETERTSGRALNPDGEIGGMRGRSRRAKGRILDRWDRQAREHVQLVADRAALEAAIREAEGAAGRAAARAGAEAAERRDRARVAALPLANDPAAPIHMTAAEWARTPRDFRSIIERGGLRRRHAMRGGGLGEVFLTDRPARP